MWLPVLAIVRSSKKYEHGNLASRCAEKFVNDEKFFEKKTRLKKTSHWTLETLRNTLTFAGWPGRETLKMWKNARKNEKLQHMQTQFEPSSRRCRNTALTCVIFYRLQTHILLPIYSVLKFSNHHKFSFIDFIGLISSFSRVSDVHVWSS